MDKTAETKKLELTPAYKAHVRDRENAWRTLAMVALGVIGSFSHHEGITGGIYTNEVKAGDKLLFSASGTDFRVTISSKALLAPFVDPLGELMRLSIYDDKRADSNTVLDLPTIASRDREAERAFDAPMLKLAEVLLDLIGGYRTEASIGDDGYRYSIKIGDADLLTAEGKNYKIVDQTGALIKSFKEPLIALIKVIMQGKYITMYEPNTVAQDNRHSAAA